MSSSSRDLALVALCFFRTDFLSARVPVAFFEQMPFAFRSVPPGGSYPGSCLPSSDVLGAAIPARLDFSIVDTVAYSRVPSEQSSSPRFGSHVFRDGGVPTLVPQARLPRETISLCWGSSPPVDAVGRISAPSLVGNVSSSSRDLALVALCFFRTDFLSARVPVVFFEQMPFAFRSVPPGVPYPGSCLPSSDVLGAAIPARLDFSIVDTVAYSRVPSEQSSSPRFGSHVFRDGGVPTLVPQARLPRETISLCWGSSPPVDAVGRLALSASTSSRID